MKRKAILIILLLITILFILHDICEAVTYTGSLSSDQFLYSADGDLVATGNWAQSGEYAYLTWTVSGAWEMGIPWTYEYTFYSSTDPDVSHVINELTNPFEIDIHFSTTPTYADIKLHKPKPGSNPNMPGDLYGIKFEEFIVDIELNTFSWIITTLHTPVWGDFYAKAASGANLSEAWNEGFLDPDPSDPASSGSIDDHLLVPNGISPEILPEPSTLILYLLGIMGMGLGWWRRKRRL